MAFLRALPLVLVLAGCSGQALNTAEVYPPVGGVIQLEIKVPEGETLSKVQFQVNDEVLSEDTDGSDGFTAELDTAELASEELVKIAAVGVRANGTTIVLRENFIRIEPPVLEEEEVEDDTASDEEETEDETASDEES